MADLPDPISRRDRQRQTREALVFAAREVFAELGYHAATLDGIARHAGFSKGAVYSNFEGKAALFLAVMDANFELAFTEAWDPFQRLENVAPAESGGQWTAEQVAEAMKGFALATLEFIAAAARDEKLAADLDSRMQRLMDAYTQLARKSRGPDETVAVEDVGALLAALDQGAGVLLYSGGHGIDQRLLRVGMRRLLDPARAADDVAEDDDGGPAMHDQVVQQRIVTALRQGPASEPTGPAQP